MEQQQQQKKLKCAQCSYSCAKARDLKEHEMHKHTGEKRFKCIYCDYRSVRQRTTRQHEKSQHPFPCQQCSETFKEEGERRRHFHRCHYVPGPLETVGPWKCFLCDHGFSLCAELRKHRESRSHFRLTYNCAVCGGKFSPQNWHQHCVEMGEVEED